MLKNAEPPKRQHNPKSDKDISVNVKYKMFFIN